MVSPLELQMLATRREFLGRASRGIGSMALASLLGPSLMGSAVQQAAAAAGGAGSGAAQPFMGMVNPLNFIPRAKRVIYLTMAGGPSHLETFDYKPDLARLDGQLMPESFTAGQPIAQLQGSELRCMGPQFPFAKYGQSGQEISSVLPHISTIADDICIIRSMITEQINHDPAQTYMNTGTSISGRPSLGSWVSYGIGSEASNLPGFIVLVSIGGGQGQPVSARQWQSGFLPSKYQGVQFYTKGDPAHYIKNPAGISVDRQRDVISAVSRLNGQLDEMLDDPEIATRISQYELAFRMQASVPDLVDISDEPKHILDMYGVEKLDGSFAGNALLARRLAERGVRFIQLYHRGWDHHGSLKDGIQNTSKLVDQASAALIKDLKQRGMLEDTLVIWGGEFGRTPMAQGDIPDIRGRDHHIKGFSIFMAGGGVQPGMTYGATDAMGYNAVHDKVHVHDFHATLLYLLGLDHKQLTYKYQGRNFRLTDVAGNVVTPIIA